METNYKLIAIIGLLVILFCNIAGIALGDIFDDMDTTLSAEEKASLAVHLGPIAKLISIAQWVFGIIAILALNVAGYQMFILKQDGKSQALKTITGVVIGALLVFGATTIVRVLGIVN